MIANQKKTVRCSIYTRKSTEEGLEQEFNSLDAQRESAEAYIASQKSEGWVCLPGHYDDGGFTGGNMDRPALRRLLDDVARGLIDCVVVYKVDRLSRSLPDFARIMEALDKSGASFVSVTQQFNTTSSMGRLTLNILLSFAQFEREIISERTRDKVAATRRKGKWTGGALLRGILRCKSCGCGMTHSFSTKGKSRYRYYVCQNAQASGWDRCPCPSVPAAEIERLVVGEIDAIGTDQRLIGEVQSACAVQRENETREMKAELASLERENKRLASDDDMSSCSIERARSISHRMTDIRARLDALGSNAPDQQIADVCVRFGPVWDALSPREQERLVGMLVERVEHDGVCGTVEVSFHPTGIMTLMGDIKNGNDTEHAHRSADNTLPDRTEGSQSPGRWTRAEATSRGQPLAADRASRLSGRRSLDPVQWPCCPANCTTADSAPDLAWVTPQERAAPSCTRKRLFAAPCGAAKRWPAPSNTVTSRDKDTVVLPILFEWHGDTAFCGRDMQGSPDDRLSAQGAGAAGSPGESSQQGKEVEVLRAIVGCAKQF